MIFNKFIQIILYIFNIIISSGLCVLISLFFMGVSLLNILMISLIFFSFIFSIFPQMVLEKIFNEININLNIIITIFTGFIMSIIFSFIFLGTFKYIGDIILFLREGYPVYLAFIFSGLFFRIINIFIKKYIKF
jgi:hypothetical protein